MTDPAHQPPITDEVAMLIERAVRGELSPEEQSRLDGLVGADPVVAEELQRAKREEDAMNTAAMLLNEQSDPERMRMAIELKLKLDRKMNFRIGFVLVLVLLAYAVFRTPYDSVSWLFLGLPLLPLLFFVIRDEWRGQGSLRARKRPDLLHKEYGKHLTRSRREYTVGRAVIIIVVLSSIVMTIDHIRAESYGEAAFIAACGSVVAICGWKSLFSTKHQHRYDQFLQGRLTLEQILDKRAESTESDAE